MGDSQQHAFWREIGSLIQDQGRIDLLACNLAAGDHGELLIAALQAACGREVAASVDETGNPASGGDWLLEVGQVDAAACYFDVPALSRYQGLMIMSQEQKLTQLDGSNKDFFGCSVSLSGNRALVGTSGAATGANSYQGAAYVFELSGGTWTLIQKLTASDGGYLNWFGHSVSLSGDRALVGVPGADIDGKDYQGAAYVFDLSGGVWAQTQKLTASDGAEKDEFGSSVSLSGDRALVGATFRYSIVNYGGTRSSVCL